MPSPRALYRRGRPWAFLAATGLAVFGVAGAGSAHAGDAPAPPDFTYSTAATAIGVQVALQRNPDFSSLPDPFDVELPHSEAKLDSFGTSVADGHVINLNGLGGIPGLVCLAAPKGTCAKIPVGQLTGGVIPFFPPPDPVDAHASYPAHQKGEAPVIGKTPAQLAVDQGSFALDAGAATATAEQYATTAFAREQNLVIPGGLTIGSATTRTTQTATADALTTTAVTYLSDVAIGGTALTIGGITTTSKVVSRPGKAPEDTTSTELSGVKSAGLNATIDGSGVHINGNGLPGSVVAQVQQVINKTFASAGVKVALQKVTRSDDASGHSVAAYGLLITYDRTVTGKPPITVSPQSLGLPCPEIIPPGSGLDPCSGVSFTLDGAYHGQIALGQVGVVSMAQPGAGTGSLPTGGPPPSSAPVPAGGSGGTPGGGGALPSGGTTVTGGENGGPPPVVVPGQRTVANQLENVSNRLEWFFPLFALGVLALIGRFRTPARLPGPK